MRVRPALLAVVAAAGIAFTAAGPAGAQSAYDYPWCSVRYGLSGARTCYFATYGQCMATISGIGGTCERNLWYRGRPARSRRR
jgi:hypothetical protein